ncbi:hypothetical protein [Methylobacterium sp. Leaf85]|uniref:hypothetical protein n=1 Tax=Methylobacterium sp. Leaf85 TaxID=1736241 RepID=UPI000A87C334|nr:hypothetical protein [Methylobacterium sp. Leaf85]
MTFSLKALVVLAMSATVSGEAKAFDAGFFKGSHVCDGVSTLDDWEFRPEGSAFDVFFRKTNASSFQKLELLAQETEGGLILVDRRGRPWVAVRFGQNGDSLQGRWLTGQGKPQADCEPFTLARSESVKARIDRLFGLLGEARPSVETARSVAGEQQTLPPFDLLPDLDQQAYRQRYAEAAPTFWRRFYDAERKRLAELPVDPPAARAQVVEEMRAATSPALAPDGSLDRNGAARQAALEFLRIVADRLAASGQPLEALPGDTVCERIATFGYLDIERLEWAVGLPVEYWDRPFTEDLLRKAQSCKDGRTVVRLLSQSYPDIEKRRKAALWLREERERFLALPLTLTSFRETNGLQLGGDELRRNGVTRMAHDRFLGAPLDPRRIEMEQAAARELREAFDGESLKSLPLNEARSQCDRLVGTQWGNEALSRLYKTCTGIAEDYVAKSVRQVFQEQAGRIEAAPKTFAGLEANDWFLMGTGDVRGIYPPAALVTEFNGKVAEVRAEAVRMATGEVDKAFAAADPLSDAPASGILQCGRGMIPSHESLRPLVQACQEGSRALAARRDELRCQEALKASGGGSGLLEAALRPKAAAGNSFRVRQLVCEAARQKVTVTFPTSGMLWWSKQYVEARLPAERGRDQVRALRWLIEPVAEAKGEWAISRLESKTGEVALPFPEDSLLPCLARQSLCR